MIKAKESKYILYVGSIESWRKTLEEYIIENKLSWKLISLVPRDQKKEDLPETEFFKEISIDFNNEEQIKDAITSLGKNLVAAVNRSERSIPYFQKIVPHLPANLLVPSIDALTKATEKTEMRKAFLKYDKSITPKFEILKEVNEESIKRVLKRLSFPVIVKPAGLAQAVLVQSAHYEEELREALSKISRKMKQVYKTMAGRGIPRILVEEIIEGDQYSVEALVDREGKVYFCPFIKYVTSGQKGFDDFFSYEQSTPATISSESVHKAKEVAEKGIHALGLRNSVAHIEMIRQDGKWYIVEIGPRIGGFREMMYKKSFGIDLGIQDIRNHMGKVPYLPRKKRGYTSVIKFFAKEEGYITSITGLRKAKKLPSFLEVHQKSSKGDKVLFAKSGGTYVFRITLFNEDKAQFIADKRKLENMIHIQTTKKLG